MEQGWFQWLIEIPDAAAKPLAVVMTVLCVYLLYELRTMYNKAIENGKSEIIRLQEFGKNINSSGKALDEAMSIVKLLQAIRKEDVK